MSVGVILLLHAQCTYFAYIARGGKTSILSAGSTGGQEDQPIAGGQVKRLDLYWDMIFIKCQVKRLDLYWYMISFFEWQWFQCRTIFDTIINNRIFERIAVILFLNKVSFYNLKFARKKTLFRVSTVFGVSVQPKAPNRFSHRMQLSCQRCVSSNRLSHCHWQLRRWQHKHQF